MNKQMPEDLVKMIIDEAANNIGTWSFSFIKKLQEDLKFFDQKKLDKFVYLILLEAEDEHNDNNMKLKIAQLLSSLRSFFLPGIVFSINSQNQRIKQIANNIPQGKLCDCTKRMFLNLIQVNVVPNVSNRIKSSSAQPVKQPDIQFSFDNSPKFPI
ncbi:hypothetical protein TVAG_165520 [Trichomonas vaginalis G3]|uniref:Uncharacterized protein n=1 Tax=Trichomonas vaginalis (strain ATCC PRA-98 / G3) TaxID=412133 RepID=A2DUN3_TRIV3|nr:hypothetical protein TVAGG3_0662720 [Trichomonas vaginalis G3]EAY15924.1 hypothetical protein TVAG_165520 [Trichomonas vaginalis G3]KAI5506615.1 hypothetical protein TVAGG3_0662720 [Trichomonas vaginalis G3]|eukprot:XP_001328147.1 hypothetical protein [Trichomonas vaginalis G3]